MLCFKIEGRLLGPDVGDAAVGQNTTKALLRLPDFGFVTSKYSMAAQIRTLGVEISRAELSKAFEMVKYLF